MKKVLIVGFHEYNNNMYPHLKVFIDLLSTKCNVKYFHFRERGYSFKEFNWFNRKAYKKFREISKDVNALKKIIKNDCPERILAIDHFAFAQISKFVPSNKLIFWSHDIISPDTNYFKNFIIKSVFKKNVSAIKNGSKVIVQDKDRQKLLEQTLKLEIPAHQLFFMPTFLKKTNLTINHHIAHKKPILMQCGGCGSYRFTDKLIAQYQHDDNYELYLHGFIFEEIKKQIKQVKKVPMVSDAIVPAEKIQDIVAQCDIGFVGYGGDDLNSEKDLNFKYIKFASGQTVEFLRLGKPLIIIGEENNLGEFIEEQNAGIWVHSLEEINKSTKTIANNYSDYSKNALKTFDTYFDSNLYIDNLLEWL